MTQKNKDESSVEIKDGSKSVYKINENEILIGEQFCSINILLQTRSGEVRRYLLRRTKNDKLVLV